jgi:7-cyano-7-deazaguanine synthase in queuosine biosynthesis
MNEQGVGNLGVAAMLTGYRATDDVTFVISKSKEQFFTNNRERLENFVSWLLNEHGCAEREFSAKLIFKSVKSPPLLYECSYSITQDIDHCLALSGGLDSLSSYLELQVQGIRPQCSFVDYNQAQLIFEKKSLLECAKRLSLDVSMFMIDVASVQPATTTGWPLDGFKIPARNFTILSLMDRFIDTDSDKWREHPEREQTRTLNYGVYAGEIMDKNRDKSRRFFDECTSIFSEYNGVETIVRSPVAHMSKTEQLKFLDSVGYLDFALNTCRTCVSTTIEPCLNCKPCFNRMLSVYHAGFADRVQKSQWSRLASSSVVAEYGEHIDDYTGDRKRDIDEFLAFLVDLDNPDATWM